MDVNKFIKTRTGAPFYLPYVRENIIENSNKYYFSRRKLDKHYPSTLSYNFPKVVETHKKYKLADLIKYYTKFKSLLNLWLNMHPFAEVTRFGIDFDTIEFVTFTFLVNTHNEYADVFLQHHEVICFLFTFDFIV